MGGILLLLGYLCCGVVILDGLVPGRDRLTRLWLGLCAGLGLMMWLPALFAFFIRFTLTAQLLGLGTAVLLAGLCALLTRDRPRQRRWTEMPIWLPLALILPLAVLSANLQYTHILRRVGDTLRVGQSTYGDLCLHLGIATSLRGAAFPPDYSLLPGTLLGYPFLGDSMVTSMLLCGSPLAPSFVITGTLMMVLVYLGFVIFSWELTRSRGATALAFVLMFINGGLGFLYALDGVGRDPTAFREIFTGFYATPTNQPALNLRWVNVICDMMVPQRTLLTGWMTLLPALWMLLTAARERDTRLFILLGVWAGAMPMIHTHSFLGLGLISVGAVIHATWNAPAGQRSSVFQRFALYGAIAVALALPQLLTWSVPQTVNGGSLRLRFNWVNNRGDGQLIDGYCWFWIKNVGLIWLLMIPAALSGKKGGPRRMLALGALCVYVVADLIQFQPNEYDNNKLFYVAYMAMTPVVGMYLVELWQHLKGVRGRALLAFVFLLTATLSGGLSIAREVNSGTETYSYQLFGADEVGAAQYIEENLPEHCTVLTGDQHNNAVAALTGRNIVCGTGSYLYFHGIDYSAQQQAQRLMLEHPGEHADLFDAYGVEYVYVSGHERYDFAVDEAWFAGHGELLYSNGGVNLYRLTGGAPDSTEN